jgi:hypothetical protein
MDDIWANSLVKNTSILSFKIRGCPNQDNYLNAEKMFFALRKRKVKLTRFEITNINLG